MAILASDFIRKYNESMLSRLKIHLKEFNPNAFETPSVVYILTKLL